MTMETLKEYESTLNSFAKEQMVDDLVGVMENLGIKVSGNRCGSGCADFGQDSQVSSWCSQ